MDEMAEKSGKTVTRDEKVEDRMPYQYPRMIKSRSLSQMHCCLTAVLDRLQKWWLKKLQSGALALMECCQLCFFETHALLIQLCLSLSLSLFLSLSLSLFYHERELMLRKSHNFCGGGLDNDDDYCSGKPCCKNMIQASEPQS